jgi:L-asparaginase II
VDAISVTVSRGTTVESVHRVHAVTVDSGRVVLAAGDPGLVTFMRSAAKPIQALALARARPDLDASGIAIASASHVAEPEQLHAVRALLAASGSSESDLECGPAGEPPSRLKHNCSGKHAGMLALARARGWPTAGYRLAQHPVQAAMLDEVVSATGWPRQHIGTGTDGCGVVAFAMPLERMAHAFAALPELDRGSSVIASMRARPGLIGAPGGLDTRLLRAAGGWFAKGGAEGVLCAGTPGGLGIALKVEDGSPRALEPALRVVLDSLGLALDDVGATPVLNSRDEVVGEVRGSLPRRL